MTELHLFLVCDSASSGVSKVSRIQRAWQLPVDGERCNFQISLARPNRSLLGNFKDSSCSLGFWVFEKRKKKKKVWKFPQWGTFRRAWEVKIDAVVALSLIDFKWCFRMTVLFGIFRTEARNCECRDEIKKVQREMINLLFLVAVFWGSVEVSYLSLFALFFLDFFGEEIRRISRGWQWRKFLFRTPKETWTRHYD